MATAADSHPTYPRARFAKSRQHARDIIASRPPLNYLTAELLEPVPLQYREMCELAVAESYRSGHLAHACRTACRPKLNQSAEVRQQLRISTLKQQRTAIVKDLQSVGILPTGLAWLLARWIVLPFLLELLKRWALSPHKDLE